MLYIPERTLAHFAQREGLPIVENECPADKTSKLHEMKELIYEMVSRYPNLKTNVFGAMQRLPLPEWEVKKKSRFV